MGTSVGAGRATRGWLWPQPNRSDRVPTGTNQVRASDHGRPLKTQPGKIVPRSTIQRFGRRGNHDPASGVFGAGCRPTYRLGPAHDRSDDANKDGKGAVEQLQALMRE